MDELLAFVGAGLSDLKTTAALAPSSETLVREMTAPLPADARCVVELGAGTGVITAALLERLPPDGMLLAFEINPRLAAFVRERLPDPRLTVLSCSAESLGRELRARGVEHVDAVISSLGLTFMDDALRHAIFDEAVAALRPGGLLTQYLYLHGSFVPFRKFDDEFQAFPAEEFFGERFSSVERHVVWRNLPPAFIYACRR